MSCDPAAWHRGKPPSFPLAKCPPHLPIRTAKMQRWPSGHRPAWRPPPAAWKFHHSWRIPVYRIPPHTSGCQEHPWRPRRYVRRAWECSRSTDTDCRAKHWPTCPKTWKAERAHLRPDVPDAQPGARQPRSCPYQPIQTHVPHRCNDAQPADAVPDGGIPSTGPTGIPGRGPVRPYRT
ncbi:Uncharacterised protein [Bordetella pertussis]|nr:Uncharacterised protein [Bordetella pertussis]CPK40765.1 Uncharacterised protein [Bordetella pertussis]